MPSFKCKDIGMTCNYETSASTEEELMEKIKKHGKDIHGLKEIPPDLAQKIKQAVKK